VNGESAKIEIIKPFERSFGLMKQVLFQPFDLKKWFVIGFAAWLANLGSGNYNFNPNRQDWKDTPYLQDFNEWLGQIPHGLLLGGIAAFIALLLAVGVVFAWLRARGKFIFIDCIAKNRAAIGAPWRQFREQGNSYFLFSLLVAVVLGVILIATALPFALPLIRHGRFAHENVYLICAIIAWAFLLIVVVFAWTILAHFMVVIMYRRHCRAREGLRAAISLISSYPGEIALYCFFWIVIAIGAGVVSCITILATCCIALLPYLGTVILLPVYVCLRGFGLLFIAQFGPEFDVWAASSDTAGASLPPPLPG